MAGPSRKTTIYDIARISGSSPSTVSAVLSGKADARRIKAATRELIEKIASEAGYSPNMQARGLRRARSGLVGMIIPIHDNRFFSSMSQSFDTQARERGLCPVIASTLRDPMEERRVVETLVSYAIDSLFVCGAADPEALGELCDTAGLPHVFIDLPGKNAPSVVTDNFLGAQLLTYKILDSIGGAGDTSPPAQMKPYFFGGSSNDYATAERVGAFRTACQSRGLHLGEDQVIECGYSPRRATEAIKALCDRLDGLPAGLFVNSLTAFEGVMNYFVNLPAEAFSRSTIGCFDYDPFAAYLQFPVHMVRQNTDQLVNAAWQLVETKTTDPVLVKIEPDLVEPRTLYRGPVSDLG